VPLFFILCNYECDYLNKVDAEAAAGMALSMVEMPVNGIIKSLLQSQQACQFPILIIAVRCLEHLY